MADREFIYLVTDDIQLTPICEDCGPNLVPVMREEEIIRCKNCEYGRPYSEQYADNKVLFNTLGWCGHVYYLTNGNGYCAMGVRRNEHD